MDNIHDETYNDMLQQVTEWFQKNEECINNCINIISTPDSCPPPSITPCPTQKTVRQYERRRGPIKATEHERAVSRAYYIAHREEILEKRRIYNLKIKRYEKNLKNKDRPKKS